jgi:hypothetical protein
MVMACMEPRWGRHTDHRCRGDDSRACVISVAAGACGPIEIVSWVARETASVVSPLRVMLHRATRVVPGRAEDARGQESGQSVEEAVFADAEDERVPSGPPRLFRGAGVSRDPAPAVAEHAPAAQLAEHVAAQRVDPPGLRVAAEPGSSPGPFSADACDVATGPRPSPRCCRTSDALRLASTAYSP